MPKLSLSTIASGYASVDALNANFDAIEAAIENTLSRDGTSPNTMSANLDMNDKRILNLPPPLNAAEPVRLSDLSDSDATGAASATLRAELAASSGSSLVGFLQAGTAAVARTEQAKLRETVSVKDFGAAGDGVTDDTAAIQAAHDAAVAGNFEAVHFPAGTYQFTTLTWSPHVGARASGKVYLRTANASGRTIQISDEYGRPALYGLNSMRNTIFEGQFYLINTNAANTAKAWSFGGSTNSYYCALATALSGAETRGFNGGVYEFRYNAFLLDFVDCFDTTNNGNRIIVESAATNTGEGIRFINTTFGSGSSYVCDVDTANAMQFDFIGCSADYCLGLNAPGNSAPLVKFNWFGGNLEWDTVANAYLQNDSASDWHVDGAMVHVTATSGWPTYVVSVTTGAGTTRFTNIKYVLPAGLNTLHRYVSATSKGVLDYSPNYQGGNSPAGLVVFDASAIIGYEGITGREISYTPTWSGTLGDGTLTGQYTRVGNRVTVSIRLLWGSTTSHAAGTQTFSIPYTNNATNPGMGGYWANDFGTSVRTGISLVAPGGTALTLVDAAAQATVTDAVPMTWANQDELYIMLTYFV